VGEPLFTPIAVIGMACRLPGGINSPELLWEALLRGDDLVTEIPPERWNADEYYDPEPGVPGRSVSRWGGFLDISDFDGPFFGLDDERAAAIDPQHRLLLQTSWEAIEHAGIAPSSLAGTQTGVYVGLCQDDHTLVTIDDGTYGAAETAACMASGRIAYALNLHGPVMTFDTSCSSGLLAVHMACRGLQCGESDLALAGGVMVMLDPRKHSWMSGQRMLSPTGRCRAFDVAADGFVRSEGCAVVLMKRLHHALEDGDRILAVIRGTACNADGRTPTISMPSFDAQVAACRAALDVADVDPDTIGAIEAHGTGTPVGDPIEFTSLAQTYGKGGPVLLGSAKSNFGHTESAAGALGLIKAILEIQHGVVPPMVHFTRLPDELAGIETGLVVPVESTPWPTNGYAGPRRAALSSFGMSGTNVHAIVEQAPDAAPEAEAPAAHTRGDSLLFVQSSTSADALRRTSAQLADWVEQQVDSVRLSDLAYTLARRRGHRTVRSSLIAADTTQLCNGLRELAAGDAAYPPAVSRDDRGTVWVFSGQGSQWAAMGASLLETEPVFAATIAALEPLIAQESGFSVTQAMTAPEMVTGIHRVQPTLFAMQVALAETMKCYGVRPGAVVGHSMGEVAAVVVAGALSPEDGVRVICRRSRLLAKLAGAGAMASVELSARQVRAELEASGIDDVVVAVVMSPHSTVIGGETQRVRDLVAAWEQRDVMAREVAVDVASHSPQVDSILEDLADGLAELAPRPPQVPFYSASLPDPRTAPACDARYWVDNLRQTVRFAAAVQAALEDGYRVFAELSPHPLLTRAVKQTAHDLETPAAALASMRRDLPMAHGLLGFVSDLHRAGAAVDFSVLFPSGRLVDAPLPTWTPGQLPIPGRSAERPAGAHTVAAHPLLGAHVRLLEEPERHAWQADVGTAVVAWLADHRVRDVPALPGAAYCEMALAAAETVFGQDSEVRDVVFQDLLLLDDHTEINAVASIDAPDAATFAVQTDHDGEQIRQSGATLHAVDRYQPAAQRDVSGLLATHPDVTTGEEMRNSWAARGIDFGPAFTGLTAVHTTAGDPTLLAEVRVPGGIPARQTGYGIHPALLDACFQSVTAHPSAAGLGGGGLILPLSAGRLRRFRACGDARYCHVTITAANASAVEADIEVLDAHGGVLLEVTRLRMGIGATKGAERDRLLSERLLTVEWEQHEAPVAATTAAGDCLLIAGSDVDEFPALLARELRAGGARCRTLHSGTGIAADDLGSDQLARLVFVAPPASGAPTEDSLSRGRELVEQVVHIARELPNTEGQPPRLYVVTRGAQAVTAGDEINLDQTGLRGLLRAIGNEHPPLSPTQIDIDTHTGAGSVAQEILSGSAEDETAWRRGRWYAARLRTTPLRVEERRTTVVDPERDGMRLQVRIPGDLQTLELAAVDRQPPQAGQVEVAVSSSSVNFADVLAAFGRYPTFDGQQPQLGLDFTGVVTAVGPGVAEHKVGDRIGGVASGGCWGTFFTCDARLVAPLPAGLSEEDAAAVSTAYSTAWYGLVELARLGAGDRVLIHSATGGVGQAAIAIARHVGAEIYATAGSPARRQLLRDRGIEHVYDSRSTDFAEAIRRDTDGYGVDVVLNSLTGAAQRAGLELLAFAGRFVEIGKRDVYGHTRVDLYPFRRNLAFHYADLTLMSISDPEGIGALFRKVYELVGGGVLPVIERTDYLLSDAATAIRSISAAEHTGRLVLHVPRTGPTRVVVPPNKAPVFRRDGSYIVTGGVGGLGLFMAAIMASAGCGRIVLSSRSQPNPLAQKTIARLRANGTDIVVECGNIAEPETAARLVRAATANGLPVRGVLHAAAVVEDATLDNITDELIERDWAPKVYGAWYLHHATTDEPLDWFCSFSSAAALLGSPGQGAYAAANSWLDAFTSWQRSQGRPASAIAWGAWADIGRGAEMAQRGNVAMINPEDGGYAFRALLSYDRGYTGYLPLTGMPWLTAVAERSPFAAAFRDSDSRGTGDTPSIVAELDALDPEEWPNRLRRLVTDQMSLILRCTVDPDRSFAEHGLDSLGNLELRTHIETQTGVRISPKTIIAYNTARMLAGHLSELLRCQERVDCPERQRVLPGPDRTLGKAGL
jgi:acyl transferase domain-containing protein/NAD(P)-dependent dehydrogenase (short-subunit alcohol dehydrogenase family)/acyl carrier protein